MTSVSFVCLGCFLIQQIDQMAIDNLCFFGAGDGNRTHVFSLEGCCTTIVLHPHIPPFNESPRIIYYFFKLVKYKLF